jgi:drug/metabolite transporter (DMT)-like permease
MGYILDLLALPFIILSGFLYGSTLVVSRFSVGQFEPTTYLGLRFLLASIGHALVYVLRIHGQIWPRDPRLWRLALILGIGTAITFTGIISSLRYQSSGVTAILNTANPAITVVIAHYALGDERLNRRKMIGVFLALGGALLLAARGESGLLEISKASPIGYGLVLGAMIVGGFNTVFARKYLSEYPAFDVASIRMFASTLAVLPLSTLLIGLDFSQVNRQGYLALGYAALIGTFLGLLLNFYNIQRFGATAGALASYILPIFATVGGVLLLDEQITYGMLAGMALILGGVWLINQNKPLTPTIPRG